MERSKVVKVLIVIFIISLIMMMSSCSSEAKVTILQVVYFKEPFQLFTEPRLSNDGNISVFLIMTYLGKVLPVTMYGPGTIKDSEDLSALIGREMTTDDLKRLAPNLKKVGEL